MKLTLEQAATRLGKSRRQVLSAIKKGDLPAEKHGGRWFIKSEDLPSMEPGPGPGAWGRKRQQPRDPGEAEALDLPPDEGAERRNSVRDLEAFQMALPLYQDVGRALGDDHAAARALRQALAHLARGCNRFDRTEKAEAYRQARDEASLAVCELVLAGSPAAERLVDRVEQELMPAFADLLA